MNSNTLSLESISNLRSEAHAAIRIHAAEIVSLSAGISDVDAAIQLTIAERSVDESQALVDAARRLSALLSAEMTARTGRHPGEIYRDLSRALGECHADRVAGLDAERAQHVRAARRELVEGRVSPLGDSAVGALEDEEDVCRCAFHRTLPRVVQRDSVRPAHALDSLSAGAP